MISILLDSRGVSTKLQNCWRVGGRWSLYSYSLKLCWRKRPMNLRRSHLVRALSSLNLLERKEIISRWDCLPDFENVAKSYSSVYMHGYIGVRGSPDSRPVKACQGMPRSLLYQGKTNLAHSLKQHKTENSSIHNLSHLT